MISIVLSDATETVTAEEYVFMSKILFMLLDALN